uniref:DUF7557 family protein n=1 Tax=Natronococcus roseus TaxID=1052014 RepID=UPI00374D1BCE
MPTIELEAETVERLDGLRIEDESYDELVVELISIYEASEYTLFHARADTVRCEELPGQPQDGARSLRN